jgi:protocatechuate 3,4-dioxygenase, alpha subunit
VSPATTPSQTVGPFFGFGLPWPEGPYVVPPGTPGAIRLHGRLIDGGGDPVPDGLVETWQADAEGRYPDGDGPFRGFGRCPTDADGAWEIHTLKPGAVGNQAPHVAVHVFARGLLMHLATRIYFADEPEANAADPVLTGLPGDAERATLLARPENGGYRLDIRLQGDGETVFFDV